MRKPAAVIRMAMPAEREVTKSEEDSMPSMRAVEVRNANAPLQLVEREIPTPAAGQVLIKVQACGVCHSDAFTVLGAFPGIAYPRIPGHEVVGVIDQVGE